MESLRIVFMGTPDFSVPALARLAQSQHDVAAVYTQPDKQRGRGKKVTFSPVKEKAVELGIPVFQPDSMRSDEVISELKSLSPDVIIVIAYGKILPKAVLDIPKYGCLNVHGSLLPKYRGAAPIQYAIKEGEAESGVTIMLLDEGMDTGKMLKKAVIPLDAKETTGTLFDKLASLGASTLMTVVDDLDNYERNAVAQDESQATYTAKITKEEAALDWTADAVVLERLIRTLDPHPGAYTVCRDGKRLKIWSADVVEGADAVPGTVIAVTKKSFTVQTGKGALRITEVQPESRKRLMAAQYLQGVTLTVGEPL
ncbi:MAG: methionyl-tRNA formyltransferase [Megasphaera massiliensis]|uniref:methionyl-tRNA formyltransferase n=1 Tax=Megasphaera massiliensis TaxID=1232428 RepID=UPI00210BF691|nr:methionyl-tRNA formyltransferase [Megasphaera massiliensis]MCQ5210758.1 methionyl-tRNA formyltransferase [Megasphaera massiliensis]MEE0657748.1 methionyl-tRNA formyltransferase [Megasphaera massiliensis]